MCFRALTQVALVVLNVVLSVWNARYSALLRAEG